MCSGAKDYGFPSATMLARRFMHHQCTIEISAISVCLVAWIGLKKGESWFVLKM